MIDEKSILRRLEEAGQPAPRLHLGGPAPEAPPSRQRYEVIGEIARGGVGIVHRARDTDLGRDVALKLLREEHLGDPGIVQRFVEEAQIGGQLQHPGIVPVMELGMRDGRHPFFAMKLVKGETLAALLAARPDPTAERRRFLGILAQACQTVAYAHARGVIHRDLKPSNIMVGAFGEVQVVDWGFAKVLKRGGVDDERRARRESTMIATVRSAGEGSASVAGSVMGTPAYMPPEQALGQVEDLDARADVFSLGATLCQVLTGKPPYTGTGHEQFVAASQCRLEDAHARLGLCGADAELVALAKRALSPLPKDRPATARELADTLVAHLAASERRAHEARLVAAKRKAEWERQHRSRRLTGVVAAAAAGLMLLGGGAHQWLAHEREGREGRLAARVEAALQEAGRLGGAGDFAGAIAAAERARDLGGAEAASLLATLRRERDGAEARTRRRAEDAALLAELEEVRARRADSLDAREADVAFVAALERRGLDASRPEEVVERLRGSHLAVELAGLLDTWACMRACSADLRGSDGRSIDAIARGVDPVEANDAIRDALYRRDSGALLALVETRRVAGLPRPLLPILGQWMARLGRRDAARDVLREARNLYPDDFWIHWELASSCDERPGRDVLYDLPQEAARALAAACALRPESAPARDQLGIALDQLGEHENAIRAYREAIRLQPGFAASHNNLAVSLTNLGDLAGAIREYREAVRLDPGFAIAHASLGMRLLESGDIEGAGAACREAIILDPAYAGGHLALGCVLRATGEFDGAIASSKEAIRLAPDDASGYVLLGTLLCDTNGDMPGAISAFSEAVRLDPNQPQGHLNLGIALRRAGKLDASIAALREAIRLAPARASAHEELGGALQERGESEQALEAFQEALRLDPGRSRFKLGIIHAARGEWDSAISQFREVLRVEPGDRTAAAHLTLAERMAALERRLPAVLRGDDAPEDAEEAILLARLCRMRGRDADAVRLCKHAIASRTALRGEAAYDAACIAAILSTETPDASEAAALRAAALSWLQAALEVCADVPSLVAWTRDSDLGCVRDRIDALPEIERDGWRKLWTEVDAQLAQVASR